MAYEGEDVNPNEQATAEQFNWAKNKARTFTDLAGTNSHTQVNNNAWEDWDLSGLIPATAKYVLVQSASSTPQFWGARKNGSGDNRYVQITASVPVFWVVECDANRVIETYHATGNSTKLWGYWS